jgi:L-asparaginase II
VRRGEIVEAVHRVHAVAVQDGAVIAEAGDSALVAFMRSSSKPLQALPVARARDDLDSRELAIASASHLADEAQLAAVRSLLAKAPASEDELECGPAGNPPSRLKHNCSGKHAGMLALCRVEGWPTEGYRLLEHPCQQAALAEVERLAGTDEIATAVDGCGVVTFALPLTKIAIAFGGVDGRVADAMRAHPDLIRGPRAADTNLMRAFPGWIAKGGAEALLCAASPNGLSLALKVEDGTQRALRPALGAFLTGLGLDGSLLGPTPVGNSRDEVVGEVRTG